VTKIDADHMNALADYLDGREETFLGPTDIEACAMALRYRARAMRRRAVVVAMIGVAFVAGSILGNGYLAAGARRFALLVIQMT
jgi:hypothetical protein